MWIIVFLNFVQAINTATGELPLNFTHDRTDGRIVWINNLTSDAIQKMEYRRLSRDQSKLQPGSGAWQSIAYDPHTLYWQKPDGICGEYEISVTTSNGKSYTQTLESPMPTFRSTSKLRLTRIFNDPIRNRVLVEVVFGNEFEYWTGAGAVFTRQSPWIKFLNCQALFKSVTPPPALENQGTLWSFDPEYVRSNCTFMVGLNGTLEITPSISHQMSNNGRLSQLPNGQQIIQLPSNQEVIVQRPIEAEYCPQQFFSTLISNESLQLNLSCDTVQGSQSICVQPQRECKLDCQPVEIRAYNMRDTDEYLKIEWSFPDSLRNDIKKYHIRYAHALVTTWNTVIGEEEPANTTTESNINHLDIKTSGPANFSIQICANLADNCKSIQWDQEKKYAIAYVPKPEASANLVFKGDSRRKAKNGGSIVGFWWGIIGISMIILYVT